MTTMRTIPAFFFEPASLLEAATARARAYGSATPFPHIVMDEFLPAEIAEAVLAEFPPPGDPRWGRNRSAYEKKQWLQDESQMGAATRHVLGQLNSGVFVRFLETLTGIGGLIPDPHLIGGGLHEIERGGHLGVHVDFNKHSFWRLDRRLNLLLYLNKHWKDEYGGHLELWSADMARCQRRIAPIFNRCVVFTTSESSFHGHPDPLECPREESRKSLALYYYSGGRPSEEAGQKHTTLFRSRPGERRKFGPRELLKRLAPPVVVDVARYVRGTWAARRRHNAS
jgi:Rps23 Pro-64 3,4-dihydroxylase Tpa1-like proline 4-hydroxylase